jgi:hypothetical protein
MDKGVQMLTTHDNEGNPVQSTTIVVEIPRNGTELDIDGKTYFVVKTMTIQDGPTPNGKIETIVAILPITAEDNEPLQYHTIRHNL